jgi:hypothetical protein
MADIFQGKVAPDVNTTKTSATTAPQFFTDYLSGIAGAGATALNRPADQLVAPLTDLQTKGYGAIPTAADAYKPQLTTAEQTAANASGVSSQDINRFMNPYTTNVVDEMARLQNQNIQRNLMPQLKAGFVGTGGLGSQRYANALGQTAADWQSNLTGQQYGALSSGYKSALDAALAEAQLQNQVAQTQGNLAGKEQELGLTGAGAMTKAGAEQQSFNQAKIDAPLKNATNAAALMRGYQVPTSVTETYRGPMAGVYSASPLSQITGLGALIGSGLSTSTNAAGTTTPGWLSTILNKIPTSSWGDVGNIFSSDQTGMSGTTTEGVNSLIGSNANNKSYYDANGQLIGGGTAIGEGE